MRVAVARSLRSSVEMALNRYRKPYRSAIANAWPDPKTSGEAVLAILTPVYDQGYFSHAKAEAANKLVAMKFAAYAYRAKHHILPNSLSQLFSQEQISQLSDPFDPSRKLAMLRRGDDLVFYSVGPDGVDDHGNLITGRTIESSKGDYGITLNTLTKHF